MISGLLALLVNKDIASLEEGVKELKVLWTRIIKGIKEAKEASIRRIEKEKQITEHLDRTEEFLEMKLNALESITPERFGPTNPKKLYEIQRQEENAIYLGGALEAFTSDISEITGGLETMEVTAGTFEAVATSGGIGFVVDYMDGNMKNKWEKRTADLLSANIDFVAEELGLIDSSLKTDFLHVTREWSAASDAEKYATLLPLRTVIFYEFLAKLYDRATFSEADWYHKDMNKWFCSVKLLIQGAQDDTNLPNSVLGAIHETASELMRSYGELSDLGKHKGDLSQVEDCYRDTIAHFADALRLRGQILHPNP